MKTHARLLLTLCGPVVVIVALLMLVTPATVGAPTQLLPISVDEIAAPAVLRRPSSSSTIRPGPPTPRPRSPSFPIHRSPVNPPRSACG